MFITIFLAGVFETVPAGLFEANAYETRSGEPLQALKNLHAEILRRRHALAESLHVFIQVSMIEWLDNLAGHITVQVAKMRDHARGRINRPGNGHLHDVVVPMPVRVVALPVDALIFGF